MPEKNIEEEKVSLSLKAVDAELTAIDAAIMRHEKREGELLAERQKLLDTALGAAEEEPEPDLKVGDRVKWGTPITFGGITFVAKKPAMPTIPLVADVMDSRGCLNTTVPVGKLTKITEAEYLDAWRVRLVAGDIVRYTDGCRVLIEMIRSTLRPNHMQMESGTQVYVGDMIPPSPQEIDDYDNKERLKAELERMEKVEQRIEEKGAASFKTWAEGTVEPPIVCTSAEELADEILRSHNSAHKEHTEELGKEGVQNREDTYTLLYDRLLEAFTAWCLTTPGLRAGSLAKTLTEMLAGGTEPDSKTRDHIAESAAFMAGKIRHDDRTQEFYIHNASIYQKLGGCAHPVYYEDVEFAKITCESIEAVEPGKLFPEQPEVSTASAPSRSEPGDKKKKKKK